MNTKLGKYFQHFRYTAMANFAISLVLLYTQYIKVAIAFTAIGWVAMILMLLACDLLP